jgi:phage gp36-like protein
MFITDQDYKVVVGDRALQIISQASRENRDNAETEAVEEISGYLRPKYDTSAIFSATGNQRNRLIVMYTCDIALYHMAAAMPQKMGTEIRKERYERAIRWLEDVQAGKIIPELPLATDEDGDPLGFPMVYGSQKKLRHNW